MRSRTEQQDDDGGRDSAEVGKRGHVWSCGVSRAVEAG